MTKEQKKKRAEKNREYVESWRDRCIRAGMRNKLVMCTDTELEEIQNLLHRRRNGMKIAEYADFLLNRPEPIPMSPIVGKIQKEKFVLFPNPIPREVRSKLETAALMKQVVRLKKNGDLCEAYAHPLHVKEAERERLKRALEMIEEAE